MQRGFELSHGRLDFRENRTWVVVPTADAGTEDVVTVDMTLEQWLELPPVQYVIKLELSRQQPRRPTEAAESSSSVPRGHMKWKDGQNWVILTAYRAGVRLKAVKATLAVAPEPGNLTLRPSTRVAVAGSFLSSRQVGWWKWMSGDLQHLCEMTLHSA